MITPGASSPAFEAMLRPCLENIRGQLVGRKYTKLQEDMDSLLEKLAVFLADVEPLGQQHQKHVSKQQETLGAPDKNTDSEIHDETNTATKVEVNDSGHMSSSPASIAYSKPLRKAGALADGAAREMMLILRDAIDTRKPAVMEAALDFLQKLVAYKLVQGPVHSINHRREGAMPQNEAAADVNAPLQFAAQPPQAQAVELICRCDDTGDEAVELRLLKTLLTVATSLSLPLHGQALLLAVRACYNVYLTSRSEVAQATSRATLTQVITVVFQRLEAGTLAVTVPPVAVSDALGISVTDTSSISTYVQNFLADVASAVDPFGVVAEGLQAGLDDAFAHGALDPSGPAVEDLYDASDPVDSQHISWRDQGSAVPASETGTSAPSRNGGESGQVAGGTPSRSETEQGGGGSVTDTDAASDGEGSHALTGVASLGGGQIPDLQSTLHKDAFLVFRALCKLSIRTSDGSAAGETAVLRGKSLALELIKIVLSNSGPVFTTSGRMLGGIRQYLCLALLKNCASAAPRVQVLCSSIFLTMFMKFRRHLKAEVGVFYPMVLLKPLEPSPSAGHSGASQGHVAASSPSDPAQRAVALRCLRDVCSDGQVLVDLFVNYDCDLDGADLLERTIAALVRVAQGSDREHAEPVAAAQRHEALACLSSMMRALSTWYDIASKQGRSQQQAARGLTAGDGDESKLLQGDVGSVDGTGEGAHREATTTPVSNGRPLSTPPTLATASVDLTGVDEGLRSQFMERLSVGEAPSTLSMQGRKEAEVLASWKAFKRVFEEGVALFNRKPAKGIGFLQAQGLVGEDPADVAQFLATARALGRSQIGDYLGEREEFALKVMHAYVDALDFVGLEFDAAIRRFLSGFRLPGEAQKIDRLMEKFAERFVVCNPGSFKSADVAYVLAYSVIMLNTDAHNPMVKNKMSKADFLRNNRGINDGGDLPHDDMEALYDRIVGNEIKMQDDPAEGLPGAGGAGQAAAGGWLDTFMSMVPGRQRIAPSEPADAAVRRAAARLREQAKGARFYSARDGEAVRPMVDASWAPVLGALSVAFEEEEELSTVRECLSGLVNALALISRLEMTTLRGAFVTALAQFTSLHAPGRMQTKHALAFQAMLQVAEKNGDFLQEDWLVVLRCVSRFDLLLSLSGDGPSDAALFAMAPGPGDLHPQNKRSASNAVLIDASSSIGDMHLQAVVATTAKTGSASARGIQHQAGGHYASALPGKAILALIDPQELNRLFVDSPRLDSDAVVDFVRILCAVSQEELREGGPPRVYALGKIVETAHFNMSRIRLVWGRIWAVLSDFFSTVGCHESLAVSMFAVDSLRQLGIKFLERDELANYTFQNDFLRPFVTLVRRSKTSEIRELVIRCVSQMVLARVANIKSGWKSVFMVFTSAATDESPHIVRLAFDTVEKIVREHFAHITETETTTFTDCVNCLVAFTNNPHSLDVSLNAIAFLRFCAMQLAEGDVCLDLGPSGLPEGSNMALDAHTHRIRPRAIEDQTDENAPGMYAPEKQALTALPSVSNIESAVADGSSAHKQARFTFTDRDEHMYFWFPLLVGLSELTFDPRPEIRHGALGVLFDILKFHGSAFTSRFWLRVFDSVLLPMFDQVRAEVLDATTFADEARRAEADAWLFETCTATLQHIVDVAVKYHARVPGLLERVLGLLEGFVVRPHAELAGVGVAALSQLVLSAGREADEETWAVLIGAVENAIHKTMPGVAELVQRRMEARSQGGWTLGAGMGARRLSEVRCRSGVQLILAQACCEIFAAHFQRMPIASAVAVLDSLQALTDHARRVDADEGLRHSLAVAYAADGVRADMTLGDPPLLRLEVASAQACLEALMTLSGSGSPALQEAADAEQRLAGLCLRILQRYEQQSNLAASASEPYANGLSSAATGYGSDQHVVDSAVAGALKVENQTLAPLAVNTLKALLAINADAFKARLARDFFPVLTSLIGAPLAPSEVQKCLADVFSRNFEPSA